MERRNNAQIHRKAEEATKAWARHPAAPMTKRFLRRPEFRPWCAAAAFALTAATSFAQNFTVNLGSPTIDKWVYPFASNGGATRPNASTFGAVGSAGFDDRDAQFFNAFDTSTLVPTGKGASNYVILSATFTLSINVGGVLVYDGTYDPINTYGPAGESINGDDAGRPMELYGAAFRNGLTSSTVAENTAFRPTAGAPAEGVRSVYATDFYLGGSINGNNRDVSNNVSEGFDTNPFAIGTVAPADLSGGTVNADANVVFTLNLANPDVLKYLQLSLDEGRVSFLLTSLHLASQTGPTTYPDLYTKENLLGGLPGRLDIQVQVVPEPSATTMLFLGFGVAVATWRGGRALTQKGKEELI